MYMTLRNKTYSDKLWWKVDMASFDGFLDQANNYDNRITLLKLWYNRKEQEHGMRKTPPFENFSKSD